MRFFSPETFQSFPVNRKVSPGQMRRSPYVGGLRVVIVAGDGELWVESLKRMDRMLVQSHGFGALLVRAVSPYSLVCTEERYSYRLAMSSSRHLALLARVVYAYRVRNKL